MIAGRGMDLEAQILEVIRDLRAVEKALGAELAPDPSAQK
jgi:hypothetical protein